jgi:hypothetical protein
MMGRLNELVNFNYSSAAVGAENMDFWNNAVGRKVAKNAKSWREVFEFLLKSMNEGELILSPSDKRKYKGEKSIKRMPKSFVIRIKENKTGANVEFLDVHKKIVMSKDEFVLAIRNGMYPGYAVRKHSSGEFPFSTRDKFKFNNLG